MVAAIASSSLFPVVSLPPDSVDKTCSKFGGLPASSDARWRLSKSSSRGTLQVKAGAQAPSKLKIDMEEDRKGTENVTIPSPPKRSTKKQLPDWSMFLSAITTKFVEAEKQWPMLDWKPRRPGMVSDPFRVGRFLQNGLVFCQNYCIRSYEVGVDGSASIEVLMSLFQETALSHVKGLGYQGDGFSTQEMCKKNLIWIVTKTTIVVDRYPTWGEVVQIETWIAPAGKNGVRRDWLIRDEKTGDTLAKASSSLAMMNKELRRLSKIPDEVRSEIGTSFLDAPPIVDDVWGKLPKFRESAEDFVRSGITPKWSDLDMNMHVNNAKYIGWIHESAPVPVLENYELSIMNLEYKRECGRDAVLQSRTAVSGGSTVAGEVDASGVECMHLFRLESGGEILRGHTEWRPKQGKSPAESLPTETA